MSSDRLSKTLNEDSQQLFTPADELTYKQLYWLQERWLHYFRQGEKFDGGNAHQWFTCVIELLEHRGDELIPEGLRALEERVIGSGKSVEYLAALAEGVPFSPLHTEHDKAVMVLTATVDERIAALRKVLT